MKNELDAIMEFCGVCVCTMGGGLIGVAWFSWPGCFVGVAFGLVVGIMGARSRRKKK